MTIAPGTRLGPYEITATLGEGGVGSVWRATDTNLGQEVALELLPVLWHPALLLQAAGTGNEHRSAGP